ncbi:DUF924 family protein [Paracoccus denitrificans]|uniref:DUF924 family protein n=1 Tax=Paracoccus denitrificans TaxID=266 RepID=UPI000CEBC321
MIAGPGLRRRRDDGLISDVVGFWKEAGKDGRWFDKDKGFDRRFRERFLDLHMAVATREHDGWMETPEGALALLILTDQFPRNAFRGTGHMYATDPLARHYARQAHAGGHMERVEPDLRLFGDQREAGTLDQIPDDDRTASLGQGDRRVRLRGNARE